MRKANVLRLAAQHADEPLHTRLLRRGEEFAARAWSDLLRFESRSTTRPLAIMMREGLIDVCLSGVSSARNPDAERGEGYSWGVRKVINPAPPSLVNTSSPVQSSSFGQPENFVPQRQRVKAQMKSLGGLLRMGLRLLSPRRWKRYLTRYRR
jgi:hypothetical protein